MLQQPRAPIVTDAGFVVYAGVIRVVSVVGSFKSVSAAAVAAAVVYVVVGVVVSVPACCRLSALNTKHKYIPCTTVISIFTLHTTPVRITQTNWLILFS